MARPARFPRPRLRRRIAVWNVGVRLRAFGVLDRRQKVGVSPLIDGAGREAYVPASFETLRARSSAGRASDF